MCPTRLTGKKGTASVETPHDVLLLYGSQTGTAEDISEEVEKDIAEAGISCVRMCMKRKSKFDIKAESIVIIISSTTGQGEPPDNAASFWRLLSKATRDSMDLAMLKYTVLGLGSTDYDTFCAMGKNFNQRLRELGAAPFYDAGFADSATGLEEVVEPWRRGLIPALKKLLAGRDQSPAPEATDASLGNSNADGAEPPPTSRVRLEADPIGSNAPQARNTDATSGVKKDSPLAVKVDDVDDEQALNENIGLPDGVSVDALRLPRPLKTLFDVIVGEADQDTSSSSSGTGPNLIVADDDSDDHVWLGGQVIAYRVLTAADAVKRTLELKVRLPPKTCFMPGDAFAVSCPNTRPEIERLISAMHMEEQADNPLRFVLKSSKRAKTPALPPHIQHVKTLREALTYACDIRSVPKKSALRALGANAKDLAEQNALLYLSSSQGSREYQSRVRDAKLNLVDLLDMYPTASLSVTELLSVLPPLQPRSYSACSPNENNCVHFVFNVVAPEDSADPKGYGLCTCYLESICHSIYNTASSAVFTSQEDWYAGEVRNAWYSLSQEALDASEKPLENLILSPCLPRQVHTKLKHVVASPLSTCTIPLYLRPVTSFRAPSSPSTPLILIGPGTGVAPFLAFLRQRAIAMREAEMSQKDGSSSSNTKGPFGEVHLFYGCRHRTRDFLFEEELLGYLDEGILTQLAVAFSRDDGSPHKYVQEHLAEQAEKIVKLMVEDAACMYICGATKVLMLLNATLDSALMGTLACTADEAKAMRLKWQQSGSIRMELWG